MKGISYTEKPLLIYDIKDDITTVYDGKKKWEMNNNEFIKIRKNPITAKYLVVFKDRKKTFEASYTELIESANELKIASKGLINMYKTGSYKKTAFYVFDKMKHKYLPGKLSPVEEELIIQTSLGALMNSKEYEGAGHKYDFKSMYGSILADNHWLVPMNEGEQKTIKSLSEVTQYDKLKYGYYRCNIEKSDNFQKNKFFRFNRDQWYTHFDLESATKLQLKIKLIKDNKPNCYIYDRSKCLKTGLEIFGKFINYMFKLKENKVEGAKKVGNTLWGGLCAMHKKKITLDDTEDRPEGKILSIEPNTNGTTNYYVSTEDQVFETNYARMKPFLLSKGRLLAVTGFLPYLENIVRFHTDGAVTNIKLDIKTGLTLGCIAYEGYYEPDMKVFNTNVVEGTFHKIGSKEDREMLDLEKEFKLFLSEGA